MRVEINNAGGFPVRKKEVLGVFTKIARILPRYAPARVSVAFVDNRTIRDLNCAYRSVNEPTDVLSFAEYTTVPRTPKDLYLGEIIISYPVAKKQALQDKKRIHDALAVLLVHGFLHLVGYDHAAPKERVRMFTLQDRIVGRAS